MPLDLAEGDVVNCKATATIYNKSGSLQLIVKHISKQHTVGSLYAQLAALKQKLLKEGLFDDHHKKPLPAYPQTIGIVTSASGSVRRDIEVTLQRRFPLASIVLLDCLVQGESAAQSIMGRLAQGAGYQLGHRSSDCWARWWSVGRFDGI